MAIAIRPAAWRVGLACALALWASCAAVAQTPPTTPDGWRAATLADLAAAATALRDNSPIPFDGENPAYARWLEAGEAEARARAAAVRDGVGHFYTLAAFANGFRDPHIQIGRLGGVPGARWPGFVAADDGAGGAIVASRGDADPRDPPLGAIIEACDGAPIARLLAERVFPFALNPALAVDRRRAVTRLFVDRGNPFAPAPRSCVMRIAGVVQERDLRWRAVPPGDSFNAALGAAAAGPATNWGLSQPAPGVAWIGIPTFQSGETADRLGALVRELEAAGPAIRQGKAIVFDVRGNGGGNSAWAVRVARAALGVKVVTRALPPTAGASVDWRASADNAAYWRGFESQAAREFGARSPSARWASQVAARLEAHKNANPPIWREGPKTRRPGGGWTLRRPGGSSPFPARVYMLSNGSCGSSCLNFADIILHVPGARLIGSATAADGAYMEIRPVALPSGLASLSVPQKVLRGGPRAPMEAYAPDIAYRGPWDDASVRTWALQTILAATP